jgi:choline monooxygenase
MVARRLAALTMPSDSSPEELAKARALPPRHYLGAEMLERDFALVFARSWQLLAHEHRLSAAGDHVVAEIGRTPILIVRGADGALRAFANVCRHRAGPLALCDGRGARALHCKYHGWTYDLEGRLRHAPEMAGADGFTTEGVRLPQFRVASWQGLVFVALDQQTPPLEVVYGGIAARITPIDLAAMEFVRSESYDIACNWKVYVDNFMEGYHLPYVHPGLSKVLDYRVYRTELSPWHSLQHSPLRANDGIYGEGEAFYYFVYPNVMLNIMPGRLQVNRILPAGPDRCRVAFDYYYAVDSAARARIARDREFSDEIQQEDIAICEAVQRGLGSGHYEPGRLCPRRESGLWHFQNLLREAYARPSVTPA